MQIKLYPEGHRLRKEDINDKMLEPCSRRRYGFGLGLKSNVCMLHIPHCCERVFADFVCPRGMNLIFICPNCGKDIWGRQNNNYPFCRGCGQVMKITYENPEAEKERKEGVGDDNEWQDE